MSTEGNADISDLDLLAHARAGDTEAYVALFGRHHDAAVQMATDLGAGEHTDDLVAEAFVSILGRLDNGEGPRRTFPTYLELVLRQLYAALPTASAGSGAAELSEASVLEPDDPRAAASPLATAFAALTPPAQVALWLREVEEVPSLEAGELTAMPPAAVDRLAHRAVEALAPVHAGAGSLAVLLPSVLDPATPPVLTLVPADPAAAGQPVSPVAAPPPVTATRRTWRRARLVPALAAAGVVAATVALVGTVVWQHPDGSQPMTAAPAQTLELNPDAPQMGVPNGGRIASALLGGQVGAVQPAVDTASASEEPSVESESPTDEQTTAAPEPTGSPDDDPTSGPSTNATDPATSQTDASGDDTNTGLKPAEVAPGDASRVGDDEWTATFRFSDLTENAKATFSVDGDVAIKKIDGASSCDPGTKTRTCTFDAAGSTTVTVTVSAPEGRKVTARLLGNDQTATVPLVSKGETADPSSEPASGTDD